MNADVAESQLGPGSSEFPDSDDDPDGVTVYEDSVE